MIWATPSVDHNYSDNESIIIYSITEYTEDIIIFQGIKMEMERRKENDSVDTVERE